MAVKIGFKEAKQRLITALRGERYRHAARKAVQSKNLLQTGEITPDALCEIVMRCQGQDYQSSRHHRDKNVEVHILRRDGWYIKFYFVDPVTIFISVHK